MSASARTHSTASWLFVVGRESIPSATDEVPTALSWSVRGAVSERRQSAGPAVE